MMLVVRFIAVADALLFHESMPADVQNRRQLRPFRHHFRAIQIRRDIQPGQRLKMQPLDSNGSLGKVVVERSHHLRVERRPCGRFGERVRQPQHLRQLPTAGGHFSQPGLLRGEPRQAAIRNLSSLRREVPLQPRLRRVFHRDRDRLSHRRFGPEQRTRQQRHRQPDDHHNTRTQRSRHDSGFPRVGPRVGLNDLVQSAVESAHQHDPLASSRPARSGVY